MLRKTDSSELSCADSSSSECDYSSDQAKAGFNLVASCVRPHPRSAGIIMPARVKSDTTAVPDSDEECEWDTTPLTFNVWYTELPDYLVSLDADYETM